MSIRLKLLVILLSIALLPVLVSGWQSLRQMDAMAASVAASARDNMREGTRHYLREKVADIGNKLELISLATASYLARQRDMIESALATAPATVMPVLYSRDVPRLAEAIEDTRFSRTHSEDGSPYVKVSLSQPSILVPGEREKEAEVSTSVQQLLAMSAQLKALYGETSAFTLWHYVGLENGVTMVYPGHGDYPEGFHPTQRPWYRTAVAADTLVWSPLSLDASTGQPLLTASLPVRGVNEQLLGVTAIDLPLRQLLNFRSSTEPWLNVSQLALVQAEADSGFKIVAMKSPLQVGSDWRSGQQEIALSGLAAEDYDRIRKLSSGQSLLLESVNINETGYLMAITAFLDEGNSYLALLSPERAIDEEMERNLAVVARLREKSLQQHLWAGLLLVIGVVIFALFFAHRITAPLIRMSATARALADGKLDTRTRLHREDEIGELSGSIDRMADSIEQLQAQQEKAYQDMILTLTRALEKKDSYTAAHSGRVTKYSLQIGRAVGLDEETMAKLRFGAITHDLGKIGIADAVLNKPAGLEGDEKEIMRQHPAFSKVIMKPLVRFREYAEIAGSHHERWDGSGYPDGLVGEAIPLLARIVAIADAWDAMTGDRVYHKGMSLQVAIDILDREKDGGQFDPELIRVFIALIRQEHSLPGETAS